MKRYAPWAWPQSDRVGYVLLAAVATGIVTWAYGLYRAVAWAWWAVQWYVRP